jgi:hypothetical protein
MMSPTSDPFNPVSQSFLYPALFPEIIELQGRIREKGDDREWRKGN